MPSMQTATPSHIDLADVALPASPDELVRHHLPLVHHVVADMIARREDEIARAEAILRDSRDPEIRRLAQAATDARARELAELRAWRPAA